MMVILIIPQLFFNHCPIPLGPFSALWIRGEQRRNENRIRFETHRYFAVTPKLSFITPSAKSLEDYAKSVGCCIRACLLPGFIEGRSIQAGWRKGKACAALPSLFFVLGLVSKPHSLPYSTKKVYILLRTCVNPKHCRLYISSPPPHCTSQQEWRHIAVNIWAGAGECLRVITSLGERLGTGELPDPLSFLSLLHSVCESLSKPCFLLV